MNYDCDKLKVVKDELTTTTVCIPYEGDKQLQKKIEDDSGIPMKDIKGIILMLE